MYELIQISDHDYYIDCPAKIGVIRISENEVVLIDGGSDKDAGKKVLKHIEANGWTLKAIYSTHSHADHTGGNKLLQDRTGCKIYANGLDCIVTNNPELEPTCLYGGLPFKDFKNKFLMAAESKAEQLSDDVLPAGFEIINLPGHSYDMVGFKTPDGNAFIADALSSEATLKKYGIGYTWNPEEAIKTLESLKALNANCYIPAHAEVTKDISALIEINIEAIKKLYEDLLEICSEKQSFDSILKQVFDRYSISMTTQQFALIGSTIKSYLSSLYSQEKIEICIEENMMFWKKK